MPAQLSVNINKYALLRNSRGGSAPDLLRAADLCLAAGSHGITVHPRADQRHIRFDDLLPLSQHLGQHHAGVELNIECEPAAHILEQVYRLRPAQCTLVPVKAGEVTSDHGWELPEREGELREPIRRLRELGIRVSLFMESRASQESLDSAAALGAHRVEIYTGPYAHAWGRAGQEEEREAIFGLAERAERSGLQLNAGHDLDRHNLSGIADLPGLMEVSIGHAQIVRALDVGTTASIRELLEALGWPIVGLG